MILVRVGQNKVIKIFYTKLVKICPQIFFGRIRSGIYKYKMIAADAYECGVSLSDVYNVNSAYFILGRRDGIVTGASSDTEKSFSKLNPAVFIYSMINERE